MVNDSYEKSHRKRPYWHVDAKWVSSILFLVFFITGILFFNISQVISQNNVIDAAAVNIESSIKDEVATYFDKTGKPIIANKEIVIQTLATAKDKAEELDSKTKEAAESAGLAFISSYEQIIKNPKNYSKNIAAFLAYKFEGALFSHFSSSLDNAIEKIRVVDPKDARSKDKIVEDITIPKVYSQKLYLQYRTDGIVFLIISFLLLIAAIYFSSGFGRLSTPGFLILLASLPGFFIILTFINYLKTSPLNDYALNDNKIVSILSTSILNAFKSQADSLFSVYKYLFFIALILLIIGVLGQIISSFLQPKSTADISPRLK